MPWYSYLVLILSGAALANAVPHIVHGISGNRFQTPFATPPGVGESSAIANVVWGFFNLAVSAGLARAFMPADLPCMALVALFAGALAMAIALARHFGQVRSARY